MGTYPLIYGLSDGLNLKGGNSYQKFREFDKDRFHDVVVVGSSHAYRGYDPRIFAEFGYTAFNMGSSSQTPFNSFFLVDYYLNPSNTGLLLLDVFSVASEMEPLESCADLIQNLPDEEPAFRMAMASKDPRAWNMYSLRLLSRECPPYYKDSAYVGSGYSQNERTAPEGLVYKGDVPLDLNTIQEKYLRKLVRSCVDTDLPIVLVDHPVPTRMMGPRQQEMHALVIRISKDYGVPFINLNHISGVDDRKHFYDHTHLNQDGVRLFNTVLIDSLQKHGLLSQE
jgi:hypothetical protein